jgi:hypothetical protein
MLPRWLQWILHPTHPSSRAREAEEIRVYDSIRDREYQRIMQKMEEIEQYIKNGSGRGH